MRIVRLLWDDWNEEHIARHGVTAREVEEATLNDPFITRERNDLYRAIGQTVGGRYLTVHLALRWPGAFYVVTARDATPGERRVYRRR